MTDKGHCIVAIVVLVPYVPAEEREREQYTMQQKLKKVHPVQVTPEATAERLLP